MGANKSKVHPQQNYECKRLIPKPKSENAIVPQQNANVTERNSKILDKLMPDMIEYAMELIKYKKKLAFSEKIVFDGSKNSPMSSAFEFDCEYTKTIIDAGLYELLQVRCQRALDRAIMSANLPNAKGQIIIDGHAKFLTIYVEMYFANEILDTQPVNEMRRIKGKERKEEYASSTSSNSS